MRELPIIFNTEMVRAILNGRKTMTRRPIKVQPAGGIRPSVFVKSGLEDLHGREIKLPFQVGDRLYVREKCLLWKGGAPNDDVVYATDQEYEGCVRDIGAIKGNPGIGMWKVTPSIHMPKWAARIWLELSSVRVERIQDISEADALAEGVEFMREIPDIDETLTDRDLFQALWQSLYPGSWERNEWVSVTEFKRIAKD